MSHHPNVNKLLGTSLCLCLYPIKSLNYWLPCKLSLLIEFVFQTVWLSSAMCPTVLQVLIASSIILLSVEQILSERSSTKAAAAGSNTGSDVVFLESDTKDIWKRDVFAAGNKRKRRPKVLSLGKWLKPVCTNEAPSDVNTILDGRTYPRWKMFRFSWLNFFSC